MRSTAPLFNYQHDRRQRIEDENSRLSSVLRLIYPIPPLFANGFSTVSGVQRIDLNLRLSPKFRIN
jgi:hypothetical protein